MWSYFDGSYVLLLCTYKQMVQGSNLSQGTACAKVFHDFTQSSALPKMVPQMTTSLHILSNSSFNNHTTT
jgi:hypothetical protein